MSWTKWNGQKLTQVTQRAANRGAEDAANIIKGVSLSQVPHNEGILSDSIIVLQDPQSDLFGAETWIVSAGGGAGTGFPRVPYALRWHENEANFQKGRKSKYVRDPLFQQGPEALVRSITQRMRQAWT